MNGLKHGLAVLLVTGGSLAAAPAALAAPFCVETQAVPPQCLYVDAAACDTEARKQGGYCSANPREVHLSTGIGHFCVLSSDRAGSCFYADRGSCMDAAQRAHAACVAAPAPAESPAPDPYRNIRPLTVGSSAGN